ncbi:11141_t:CDS:2, partial [Funneliformis geosporum]
EGAKGLEDVTSKIFGFCKNISCGFGSFGIIERKLGFYCNFPPLAASAGESDKLSVRVYAYRGGVGDLLV